VDSIVSDCMHIVGCYDKKLRIFDQALTLTLKRELEYPSILNKQTQKERW
jgi:hypothetical protein